MSALPILLSVIKRDVEVTGEEVEDPCAASFSQTHWGLRIAAIFIILVTSVIGTILPIVLRQSSIVPRPFFDFAKYFGSGVIIATAFIHLMAPAFESLGSECLKGAWGDYSWAPAIALIAVFAMFFAEVAAYRIGTAKLMELGVEYSSHVHDETDAHAHSHQHDAPLDVNTTGLEHPGHVHPSAIPRATANDELVGSSEGTAHSHTHPRAANEKPKDIESLSDDSSDFAEPNRAEAAAQLIAVGVLEFGVILHSIIIGLTLAVSDEFIVLFIVIIFHQMFEGLGLGSRLAGLRVPRHLGWARYAAALLYSICTPVGIAVGLGVRETYNGNGATATAVSGVLDAFSAGILLYTGLVELLAHEILLNPRMMKSSNGKLAYAFVCMSLGAGIMALLGRWA